ncbi:MAG: hypothetical protein P9M14_10305 [Candidatus Alcyoniella australis]|nr:hypothetical protein [Candidatus Alcyoniella australis]
MQGKWLVLLLTIPVLFALACSLSGDGDDDSAPPEFPDDIIYGFTGHQIQDGVLTCMGMVDLPEGWTSFSPMRCTRQ